MDYIIDKLAVTLNEPEVHGLKEEDMIEGCEIVGATTFENEAQGSNLTFSF